MRLGIIAGACLLVLAVVFALQNTQVVTLRFLFWQFSLSRALLVLLVLLVGIVVGWLLHGYRIRRKRRVVAQSGASNGSSNQAPDIPGSES